MRALADQFMVDVSKWSSSIMNPPIHESQANADPDAPEQKEDSKTDSKILSTFMSQVIDENLFVRLIHPKHRNAAQLWSKLCHKIDISYPPKNELKFIDVRHNSQSQLMRDIRYSMRHSFCAYQAIVVGMKSEEVSLSFKTQRNLLKTCFNISDDDIIIDNCTLKLSVAKTHEPAFYLIVDHNKKKIVLCIRGTSSVADVLTDLNAATKAFELCGIRGFVHEGILEAAYFMRIKVSLQLINLCERYSDYGVIICGHSLGAGIAALLGFMYKDHPIIHKQNRLRVYSFASPCIISKQFTDCELVDDYITSIALETDVVTRLSVESVRKCNLRQDLIMKQSKDMIYKCMTSDIMDDECSEAGFLRVLRSLSTVAPSQELYPLGRILWFVPKIVMHDDIVWRRKYLMDLKASEVKRLQQDDNENKSKLNDVFISTWNNISNGVKEFKSNMVDLNTWDARSDSSSTQLFSEVYHDLCKGVKDLQTDIRCKLDKNQRNRRYNGDNYILCDASSSRYIFQELVFCIPESLHVHEPQRYLWACDATLRE